MSAYLITFVYTTQVAGDALLDVIFHFFHSALDMTFYPSDCSTWHYVAHCNTASHYVYGKLYGS